MGKQVIQVVGFHYKDFRKSLNIMSLKRHMIEISGNFIMVPFLLSLKPFCSRVYATGDRIIINERGNGI